MERYERVFVLPCLAVICLTVCSGFGSESEEEAISSLLQQRTDLLQQAYYNGIQLKTAEKKLAELEVQPLLAEDIQELRYHAESELDRVNRMEFLSLERISGRYDYRTYRADIRWDIQGVTEYQQTVSYFVVLKKTGNGFKLSAFTPEGRNPDAV